MGMAQVNLAAIAVGRAASIRVVIGHKQTGSPLRKACFGPDH